jgi:ABC-type multidrug transport system fused ATPase/permease subunit
MLDETSTWRLEASPSRESGESRLFSDGDISLAGVSYAYPNAAAPTLKNINLVIERGTKVAFVGPSGAGKSTLVALLLGLLKPTSGEMRVGDRRLVPGQWNRELAYVPQSIFLLDDTIRANVLFGLPVKDFSEDELWQALDTAQLANFVRAQTLGLDARVGENGVSLSGGERQRLGLARALLVRPSVLVLDEATAALDTITESRLMEAVMGLYTDITTVFVAHRLTTVRNCDVLHYIEGGQIIQSGTYDELLRSCLGFQKMVFGGTETMETRSYLDQAVIEPG